MSKSLKCSCGKLMVYSNQPTMLKYNNKDYLVTAYFYKCDGCGEEYTTNESDEQTLMQIPEYVKRHGL